MRNTVVFLCILFMLPIAVHAEDLFPEELLPTVATDPQNTLKGGDYQLELSPLETESNGSPQTTDTLTPQERAQFNKNGFVLTQKKGELKVSLSNSRIGLGSIAGDGVHTGKVEIAATPSTTSGYEILAQQRNTAEEQWNFQPTICNGSKQTCTATKAAPWTEEKAYGFGYSLSGPDTSPDFKNAKFFRPLPNGFPIIIAANEKTDSIRSLTMNYKLKSPPSTEEAVYSTIVEIVAIAK